MTEIPRPEYPRPQMARERWLNLNGAWEFEIDAGRSGRDRRLPVAERLRERILVPFCPESRLSGLGYTDFMPAVWYRRTFTLPTEWAGQRVLLHFGAVDYETEVWVNGQSAGTHRGGYTSFTLEITPFLQPGENVLIVCAEDDTRSPLQPTGKQSGLYASHGCHYTRTTGIWQTVWLEPVPQTALGRPKITPDPENGQVYIEVPFHGPAKQIGLEMIVSLDGDIEAEGWFLQASGHCFRIDLPIENPHLWSPETPTLYDLQLTLLVDGVPVDMVRSYFGMRSLCWNGPAILLNGKPVFQRLILDQGFYPDGIYTAPSDDELRRDIERAQAMGFNGARLHQKVFEERFLYWADKLGYLVWGEMADWGLDLNHPHALDRFLTEWREELARDYSHPSIVGWCPFNERMDEGRAPVLRQVYCLTKQLDSTRPVIDTSGYCHAAPTDVYDSHDYEQDPAEFAAHYADFAAGRQPYGSLPERDTPYTGQPFFVSEYGGIWWNPGQRGTEAWGYGNRPTSEGEFLARFRALAEAQLRHPRLCGLCYTQLTDVEQEVNGLYTYDRQPKFNPAAIKEIMGQKAAIEE